MCELTFLTKKWWVPSQLTFTCSKSTTEALRRCKICSKLIKTPERRQWRCCIFTVNFEHITHLCILPQYNHAVVAEVTATTAWLYWGRMQMWLAVALVGNKLNTELSPSVSQVWIPKPKLGSSGENPLNIYFFDLSNSWICKNSICINVIQIFFSQIFLWKLRKLVNKIN